MSTNTTHRASKHDNNASPPSMAKIDLDELFPDDGISISPCSLYPSSQDTTEKEFPTREEVEKHQTKKLTKAMEKHYAKFGLLPNGQPIPQSFQDDGSSSSNEGTSDKNDESSSSDSIASESSTSSPDQDSPKKKPQSHICLVSSNEGSPDKNHDFEDLSNTGSNSTKELVQAVQVSSMSKSSKTSKPSKRKPKESKISKHMKSSGSKNTKPTKSSGSKMSKKPAQPPKKQQALPSDLMKALERDTKQESLAYKFVSSVMKEKVKKAPLKHGEKGKFYDEIRSKFWARNVNARGEFADIKPIDSKMIQVRIGAVERHFNKFLKYNHSHDDDSEVCPKHLEKIFDDYSKFRQIQDDNPSKSQKKAEQDKKIASVEASILKGRPPLGKDTSADAPPPRKKSKKDYYGSKYGGKRNDENMLVCGSSVKMGTGKSKDSKDSSKKKDQNTSLNYDMTIDSIQFSNYVIQMQE